jgi:predicted DNA-binding transcriptional regulator YafY
VQILGRGKRLSADVLANRLEVSRRTIYRDIQDLSRSGIPIEGEPVKVIACLKDITCRR